MPPKRKRTSGPSRDAGAAVKGKKSTDVMDGANDSVEEQQLSEQMAADPPAKRTRPTRSEARKEAVEAAVATMPTNGESDGGGENGEAGHMRMEAPPPAGMVDPVGYKTNPPPEGRPVRVYADGVFDMFHLGHMRVLQQAKTAFPNTHLIVGVTGEAETHKRKGLTVMSARERAESLRHCRWVDEVIEDCPWIITVEFMERHKIDFVAHDDLPYGANEGDDIYKPIKERGQFLVTQRTEGVSTTGIITKIIRDYEQYIARQLKRGSSRQELNISWLKKNELDIKRHVAELRDNVRQNWTSTGQELSRELRRFWEPNSRSNSPAGSLRDAAGVLASNNGAKSPLPGTATPGNREGRLDFASGYAMGLIGGVKSWMEGSKRRHLSESDPCSPNATSDDGEGDSATRGRA